MSKKLYPREAASFLPTEDLPVPIMPTRKTLEPSRRSATSAAVSALARHARALRRTGAAAGSRRS